MPDLSTPFLVEASIRLPGLGLLVLPTAPAPDWLTAHELHTALTITLSPNAESSQSIIGTIEEISHDGQPEQRALLLAFDPDTSLTPGTYLQASIAPLDLL